MTLYQLDKPQSIHMLKSMAKSPQSARCKLCFQHCIQRKHSLSTVANAEKLPKYICGSYGNDHIPNVEVLRRANMSSIEATLTASQLVWTGHITRMNDSSLPKAVFYGELAKEKRLRGGQRLRYKDIVKPKGYTHIAVHTWEALAQGRQQWRQAIHKGKNY